MNKKLYLILFILVMVTIIFYIYRNNIESFNDTQSTNKKIAFCFLIYDGINHEKLWYDFFSNVDKNKYNIYIHYKENKQLEYFEEYKIDESDIVETAWGDNSLVKAQINLYKNAMKDPDNYKMIMVSNSCIPLKNFEYIYNHLTKDHYGYFNKMTYDFLTELYVNYKLYSDIGGYIYKASQWAIINRKLADLFINSKNVNKYDNKVSIMCPDEAFFITEIYANKMTNEIKLYDNMYDGPTFVAWYNNSSYKSFKNTKKSSKKPHTFTNIDENELNYLINSNCLFGRKFTKECTGLDDLIKKINTPENKLEFIHIPKTGGTSIENLGKKYNIHWGIFNNIYMVEKNIENVNFWHNNLFMYDKNNFTIVRNPYDRIISEFFYRLKIKWVNYDNNIEGFKKWLEYIFKEYKKDKNVYDNHILPQTEYVYDKYNNKRIEYVLKLEDNINEQLDNLFKQYNLNIDINMLEHNNTTNKTFGKNDLDQITLDSIYEFYKRDFELLGYEKINKN